MHTKSCTQESCVAGLHLSANSAHRQTKTKARWWPDLGLVPAPSERGKQAAQAELFSGKRPGRRRACPRCTPPPPGARLPSGACGDRAEPDWTQNGNQQSHRPPSSNAHVSPEPRLQHSDHARRTVGIRMALLTTERRLWHCGDHTAKLKSVSSKADSVLPKVAVVCGAWHVWCISAFIRCCA